MRVAPGTWRLAGIPIAVGAGLLLISSGLGVVAVLIGVAVVWFHRDPEREPPPVGVVSPADGSVSVIRKEEGRVRVGVFMGVTDVHVNRAPVDGTVRAIDHVPGAHRPAFSKESDRNERLAIDLGDTEVTLIAGAFARRIHAHVAEGDRVTKGERIGHVSFGSRADVKLPREYGEDDLQVAAGDTVRAGETIIAAR